MSYYNKVDNKMLAPSKNKLSPSVQNSNQLSPERSLPQMRLESHIPFESAVSEPRLVTDLKKSKKKILNQSNEDRENSVKSLKNSLRESQKKYYENRENHQKQVQEWLQSGIQLSRAGSPKCARHKQINNKLFLYVCLEERCCDKMKIQSKSEQLRNKRQNEEKEETLDERILCKQCINEQLHRGHQICTLGKFEQFVYDYHWASIQATKTVLSKVMQLRHNIDHYLNELSLNIIQTMTLGLCGQFQIQGCSSAHQHKHYERQNTMSNEVNSKIQKSQNLITPTAKQHITDKGEVISKIGLQTWRQLLASSKQTCLSVNINNILSFKQESISQQIQDINASCQMLIQSSLHNIKFINEKSNCIFNPDDMSTQEVGLTLDRNKLNFISNSEASRVDFENQKNNIIDSVCSSQRAKCKIAFAQTLLDSESSRSFCIESIQGIIQVGCVSSEDHKTISTVLNYDNYDKLVYGIRIENKKIILLRKGQQPIDLPHITIKDNDIIEFTLHHKQSTLVICKLSYAEKKSKVFKNCKLQNKTYSKSIITILPIEQLKQPACLIFAGVSTEGDCVSIVQNINSFIMQNEESQQLGYKNNTFGGKTEIVNQYNQKYPQTYSKIIKKAKNETPQQFNELNYKNCS